MASEFMQRLSGGVLLGDGAMGTQLLARGLPQGHCPEEWNLSRPEVIAEIHKAYFDAGADFVETNTFGGSPIRLAQHGLDAKTEEINRAAAAIAKKTAPDGRFVAGSVGPTGALLKPLGDKSPEEMFEGFLRQITGLVEGGADVIYVETMADTAEAHAAISAAKQAAKGLPIVASMTFQTSKKGMRTMMGVSPEAAVKALAASGADIIGSNCGGGIESFEVIMREMRKCTDMPLAAVPNAGMPEVRDGKNVYPGTPEQMAEGVVTLTKAGANIVGGCCGTDPSHIAKMKEKIESCRS